MTAQEISNVATILVAVATAGLAWVTYLVAKASRDALLLQVQPQLAFRGISLNVGRLRDIGAQEWPSAIRVGLRLWNPGKVKVQYHVENISASFNGNGLVLEGFLSKGGAIFPDQELTFFCPVSPLPGQPYAGSEGIVDATIRYWSVEKQPHTLALKYKFIITSLQPNLNWEWVQMEDPKYDA